jgi:hypothetical protein
MRYHNRCELLFYIDLDLSDRYFGGSSNLAGVAP